MRILIHDYGAYAFPVQLSRELARRGHQVQHLFSDYVPRKGRLWQEPADPPGFQVDALGIGEPQQKYNYIQRRRQERVYGRALADRIERYGAEVVLSCNTPIDTSAIVERRCREAAISYVHWAQDIHALAIRSVLGKKLPVIGPLIARHYLGLERKVIENAAATIVISDDFLPEFRKLKIAPRRTYTVHNWMPLDEMAPADKRNPWSIREGLDGTINIIYIGTLSFKHEDQIFAELAKAFAGDAAVRVVVISAGIVFDRLAERRQAEGLDNLVLLGWQKYEDIANILAAGDILLAAVTPDASAFSVPCKVLSYLSAGRPVLAALPPDNLVAKILLQREMGLVGHPHDPATVIAAAERLVRDPALRQRMAAHGRKYALETFEIGAIADRFEHIIAELPRAPARREPEAAAAVRQGHAAARSS